MTAAIRQRVRTLLASRGYVVFNTLREDCYAHDGLFTFHSDHFRADPAFQAAYARAVQANQGVDPRMEWRLHVALWAAAAASRVPGDFVECGVNGGFVSSAIMRYLGWQQAGKQFHLIDTFRGPVLAQYSAEEVSGGRARIAEEAFRRGDYVTDLDCIHANFAQWPNVNIVQGVVPDILPSANIRQVAFLHLDMNCAYPERAALEYFWNLLSPGGMVLFDDYAYFGNGSLMRAIDSLAARLGCQVLSLPTGQGLIAK